MKLIIQADDFSMTDATAEGILKCCREDVMTQIFVMTNGPHSKYYVDRVVKEHPDVLLGLEINLVSGRPVSDRRTVPSLTDERGYFLSSVKRNELDRNGKNDMSYKEILSEMTAQYERFVEYTGHKPFFTAIHSYHNQQMNDALKELQQKYHLDHFHDLTDSLTSVSFAELGPWYQKTRKRGDAKERSLDYQYSIDPLQMFMDRECHFLTDYEDDPEYTAMLHTHASFVDKDLLDLSTLHILRLMELNFLCSPEFKKWIKEKNIELVNFRDLVK